MIAYVCKFFEDFLITKLFVYLTRPRLSQITRLVVYSENQFHPPFVFVNIGMESALYFRVKVDLGDFS